MCKKLVLLITFFLTSVCLVKSYRILGVFPVPTRSHYFLGNALMKALAEAGHDVTIIAPFKDDKLPSLSKNGSYREVILDGIEEAQKKRMVDNGPKLITNSDDIVSATHLFNVLFRPLGEECVSHPNVQALMKSNANFDVVIVTEFMLGVLKGFASYYNAPLVLFVNVGFLTRYYEDVGNVVLPSVEPVINTAMPHRMSFFQRFKNVLEKMQLARLVPTILQHENELLQKYFPNVPTLEEISKNTSLVLVNTHCSTEVVRPMVPSIINIGGFHVKEPKKLPEDLQQIMDNAKEGVIYFSFGTLVNLEMMPVETLQSIFRVLEERSETVLWKFTGNIPMTASNVIIRKWLPQQEILAHPNTKLFITHNGYLSTVETAFYNVPTVSVPFFGDQLENARFANKTGSAFVIPFDSFGSETLRKAIEEVISNPKYREAAKQKSRIMSDRQNKPIDDAIYWVEYVVRHKGAKHLRVPYLDMPQYQIYLLDVIGVIFVGIIVIILSLVFATMKLSTVIMKHFNKIDNNKQLRKKEN